MGCSDLSDVYSIMQSLSRGFPGGPMVMTLLPAQAVQVQSLVREDSHMSCNMAKGPQKKILSKSLFNESM